jgi:hypothetical protein
MQAFACDGGLVRLQVEVFPPRAGLSRILAEQRRLSGEIEGADADNFAIRSHGTNWRLTLAENPPEAAATALWIDGAPASGGLATRITQARNSLFGSDHAPVLAVVRPVIRWAEEGPAARQHAKAVVQAFLGARPALGAELAALAGGRPASRP